MSNGVTHTFVGFTNPPITPENHSQHGYSLRLGQDSFSANVVSGTVIDLSGRYLFAGGFLNTHDHLELNHYPRTRFHPRYSNAREWASQMNSALSSEPFASLRAFPYWDKAFIGGLKNLLAGVTKVIQHGPPRPELFHRRFPVTVIRPYEWAHSLYLAAPRNIQRAFQRAGPNRPFFIHVGEGTDHAAKAEYSQLKSLGCVDRRTVLIHGVGLAPQDTQDALERRAELITCLTTNEFLLGSTPDLRPWIQANRVTIGSDSRLTADGDFLHEAGRFTALYGFATFQQAHAHAQGRFCQNHSATDDGDLTITGPGWHRRSVELVVRRGIPQIGTVEMMKHFPQVQTVPALLDGEERRVNRQLAVAIQQCKLMEAGFSLPDDMSIARRWWRWS
jgi:hypothetical protein